MNQALGTAPAASENHSRRDPTRPQVNNSHYDELGDDWYEAHDRPIALLRAEAKVKNPWVEREIASRLGQGRRRVLDIGCGAGFLSNHLAAVGHEITGLDASESSLDTARKYDPTGTARYLTGDAHALPFEDGQFEVVCAMDFLEHVEEPARVVREAARVLAPGGLFFFHTFNRNWLSGIVVIKLVEWFVPRTPPNLHVYGLFIKPRELAKYCEQAGLIPECWRGIRPRLLSAPALRILWRREIDPGLEFDLTHSLRIGYLGIARKSKPATPAL